MVEKIKAEYILCSRLIQNKPKTEDINELITKYMRLVDNYNLLVDTHNELEKTNHILEWENRILKVDNG